MRKMFMVRARIAVMIAVFMLTGLALCDRAVCAPANHADLTKTLYTAMEYRSVDQHTTVIIRYPEFNVPALDKLIRDKAMEPLADFQKSVNEYMADDLSDESRQTHYELIVDFDIRMLTAELLSMMFSVYVDYSGAHPSTLSTSLAADMKTGAQIALADIFVPGSDFLGAISEQTVAHFLETLDSPDQEWIMQGAGPDPMNYAVFHLEPYAIVFHFNPYQVASYAQGPQEKVFYLFDEPLASMISPAIQDKLSASH